MSTQILATILLAYTSGVLAAHAYFLLFKRWWGIACWIGSMAAMVAACGAAA